uniref:THAP-type domain-containing protein n=1 Tax=Nothobranchius furzeri TaxID=105023 RepID=A0A8C6PGB1_NOTFU
NPTHCAAFGCNFQSEGNKGSDVSLHSFPTGKKRRRQWEDACGGTQLPKDPLLCSQLLSPDLTGAAGYKRRWKLNALPTIFPHKDRALFSKHPSVETDNAKQRYALCCPAGELLCNTLQETEKYESKTLPSIHACLSLVELTEKHESGLNALGETRDAGHCPEPTTHSCNPLLQLDPALSSSRPSCSSF